MAKYRSKARMVRFMIEQMQKKKLAKSKNSFRHVMNEASPVFRPGAGVGGWWGVGWGS